MRTYFLRCGFFGAGGEETGSEEVGGEEVGPEPPVAGGGRTRSGWSCSAAMVCEIRYGGWRSDSEGGGR